MINICVYIIIVYNNNIYKLYTIIIIPYFGPIIEIQNDFLSVLIFFPDKCMFYAKNKIFLYIISKSIFT